MKIPSDIQILLEKLYNDEATLSFDEARKIAAYLMTANEKTAYKIAYTKMNKAQRLASRKLVDDSITAHTDKVSVERARRMSVIMGLIDILGKIAIAVLLTKAE